MPWNWELPGWPQLSFDFNRITDQEKKFLLSLGGTRIFLQNHESRIAKVLYSVYETFDQPLTHEILWKWHVELFRDLPPCEDCGKYRRGPVELSSYGYHDIPMLHFEGPPPSKLGLEMAKFVQWFNSTRESTSILGRAAVAYVYFLSIHPFKDGNGRVARVLIEKILSQGIGRPCGVAKILEQHRTECCINLKKCNRSLVIQPWVEFFADLVADAVTSDPQGLADPIQL